MGAVLFDIDGTLTDTNHLHVLAWRRAFVRCGHDIPMAWVHERVGMASGFLLDELLPDADDAARDAVKDAWSEEFDRLKPEVAALPGAADLLRAVHGRGATVVLASSSEEADLDVLLRAIDADDVIHDVTSAGDVDVAKPDPEVFQAALKKAGAGADEAIVVGDTRWDVEAARRAGLDCVCLLTGGIAEPVLRAAGAVAIHRDAPTLLADLDGSALARAWTAADR